MSYGGRNAAGGGQGGGRNEPPNGIRGLLLVAGGGVNLCHALLGEFDDGSGEHGAAVACDV